MMFTPREIEYIIEALETYDVDPLFDTEEDQHSIITSALAKLKSFTILTHFTQKELSLMAYAVLLLKNLSADLGKPSKPLAVLFEKLVEYADKNTN